MNPELITELVELFIPLAGMALAGFVVYWALKMRAERDRQIQETVRYLAERNMDIPPELFQSVQPSPNRRFFMAMSLVGAGIGLCIFFFLSNGNWGLGAIPLFMGVAQLVAIEVESRRKNGGPADGAH